MTVYQGLICLSLCVLVSCSGNGIADPTFLFDGYTGITYTNNLGEYNGPIDPDDWQASSGSREYQNSGPEILPTEFIVRPAFPNPSDDLFTLLFVFPTATPYSIAVLDFSGRVIESFSGESPAVGIHVQINLSSEKEDVYRVFYAFGNLSGYGDLWLVKPGYGLGLFEK